MNYFICPACKKPLSLNNNSYICENNHSYDKARQGYVHLVMPNKMHSKVPGDTKDMVNSRRNFLEKGFYNKFSTTLSEINLKYMKNSQTPVILDAGCGEGYYTNYIKEKMPMATVCGFDISKFAVRSASAKYKDISFAVASIFNIPFMDNSCDCLTAVFAPIYEKEFLRVLKSGGILVLAVPGKNHLYQLKEILYDQPYVNEEKDTDYEGFEFLERVTVKDQLNLDNNEDIWNLFSMTPYYWKTDIKGSERLKNTHSLETEIHFDFLVYRKL